MQCNLSHDVKGETFCKPNYNAPNNATLLKPFLEKTNDKTHSFLIPFIHWSDFALLMRFLVICAYSRILRKFAAIRTTYKRSLTTPELSGGKNPPFVLLAPEIDRPFFVGHLFFSPTTEPRIFSWLYNDKKLTLMVVCNDFIIHKSRLGS